MPYALNRACPRYGCPHVGPAGSCPQHGRKARQREYNAHRPAYHALYGTSRWRKTRRLYLSMRPLCQHCERDGRVELASEVHHVRKIADGGAPLDFENLCGLCRSCHSRETARGR